MVYVTPQIEIDRYFESENLSQSTLKPLLQGLDKYLSNQKEEKELYYEEKGSLVIGSAVDCILTGEEGKFDDLYHVSQIEKKPSDVEMSILNMLFDTIVTEYPNPSEPYGAITSYPELLNNAIEFNQWYGGKPGDKRIAGLIERGSEYFEDLKLGLGKQIIDAKEIFTISSICESLRTNPVTKSFFDREQYSKFEDIDVYYQLPVYFEYKGIACKALLDMLFVFKDQEGNVVSVLPVDLKTLGWPTIKFAETSFRSFRYDIQGAWYTEALRAESSSIVNIVGDNSNLKIENFKFVVESTLKQGTPLVFELSNEVLHIGKYGRSSISTANVESLFSSLDDIYQPIPLVREVRGFDSLIDEYLYYQEHGWDKDKKIPDNGVLKIGWEGIIEQHAN